MTTERFEQIFENQVSRSREILCRKAKEYATVDRLHNFKVAAALQGVTPVEALAGMMAKHTVSVYDLARGHNGEQTLEMWEEKLTDSINYLILLRALVDECVEVDE